MQPRLYIDDGDHWRVTGARDLARFFRAAHGLSPDGVLCIAEGAWPVRVLEVLRRIGVSPGELPHPGSGCEHRDAWHVLLTPDRVGRLVDLADVSAEPEIGLHFSVFAGEEIVLEWMDAVADPIAVSPSVPDEAARRFADDYGGAVAWTAHGS